MQSEVDVAIVGAGVAGLAAARSAADSGLSYVVLESRDRIGGRTYTESESLGIPFDHGADRLHHATRNALASHAYQNGFGSQKSCTAMRIHEGRWYEPSRQISFEREARRALESVSMRAAVRQNSDVRRMLDIAPDFADLFHAYYENCFGAATGHVAAGEHHRQEESTQDLCFEAGLGTLVTHYGRAIAVVTNCPVTEIDHSGRLIRVVTPQGVLRAHSVVITVSTGVLAREKIRFTPPLPATKLDAIEGTPMGYAGKVAFALAADGLKHMGQHQALIRAGGGLFAHLHFRPHDQPILVAVVGGALWEAIERQGSAEMAAAARELICGAYGAELCYALGDSVSTDWLTDPFTQGGQSYVRPGYGNARAELARPIDGRIFFAGEACSQTGWATVHGAFDTGRAAIAALSLMR